MKALNICYSTNEDFAKHTAVSITSLLENNAQSKIIVHILYSDLGAKTILHLSAFENRYSNARILFHKIESAKFKDFQIRISHITKETYFRYLIPDIITDVDNVLYLDGDTVINGDISELFDIDLTGFYCAGVRDIYIEQIGYKKEIGLTESELYINAGVILFNLEEIRKSSIIEKLFNLSSENDFKFQDQDTINIAFKGKIKELDCIYNFKRAHQKAFPIKVKSAKIVHYVGPNKPWRKFSLNKLKRIYFKYEKISSFKNGKIKVGLLVDEYFGAWKTAFGGYGFLAREIVAKHLPSEEIELEVILGKQKNNPFWASSRIVDGIKIWRLPRLEFLIRRWLANSDFDCWLSIEMCYDYVLKLDPNPYRKLILWIQDPRPKSVWNKIAKMRKVVDHNFHNQNSCDYVRAWFEQGRVKFITQGKSLSLLARELYSLPDYIEPDFVPNPVNIDLSFKFDISKKEKIVIFLGRLEAQKRAWIFCEIAKLMPEYDFYVMGKFYRNIEENKKALSPYLDNKVKNLHFCGHLVGAEKNDLLRRARVLVNTSIWEGIPISWIEALSYGTLLVSSFDRDDLVRRFGAYVGEIKGDGKDSARYFVEPIKNFLENDVLYEEISLKAISYVRNVHNFKCFEDKMRNILVTTLL